MEHSRLDWDCRTAAMQPVAGWQPDIARSPDRGNDRRRHTQTKSACKLMAKKERGGKNRRKAKTETEKRKLIDHSRQAGRYCAPDVARSIDDRHELC